MIHVNVYALPNRDTSVRIPLPQESRIFGDHAHGPHIEARRAAMQARFNRATAEHPDWPAFIVVLESHPALAMVTGVTGEES
jgi:hypothetical protein